MEPYNDVGIRSATVTGADGVPLHVLDAGPQDAPAVILLHGFAQSAWSWIHQLTGAETIRVIAPDLRGHGDSGKPGGYLDERVWADDVAAVVESLRLDRPVLGGWSYGGLVALDYLALHGDSKLSGLLTVGATLLAGVPGAERMFGPDFVGLLPELTADDEETAGPARRKLLEMSTERPLGADLAQTLLTASLKTPPRVCAALLQRPLDRSEVAAGVTVPWLAVQGSRDRIVAPAAAEHIATVRPATEVMLWEGTGHSPFLEDPSRFRADLHAFVRESASRLYGHREIPRSTHPIPYCRRPVVAHSLTRQNHSADARRHSHGADAGFPGHAGWRPAGVRPRAGHG